MNIQSIICPEAQHPILNNQLLCFFLCHTILLTTQSTQYIICHLGCHLLDQIYCVFLELGHYMIGFVCLPMFSTYRTMTPRAQVNHHIETISLPRYGSVYLLLFSFFTFCRQFASALMLHVCRFSAFFYIWRIWSTGLPYTPCWHTNGPSIHMYISLVQQRMNDTNLMSSL